MPDVIDALIAEAEAKIENWQGYYNSLGEEYRKGEDFVLDDIRVLSGIATQLSAARAVIEEAKAAMDRTDYIMTRVVLSKFPSGETAPLPEFGATATAAESPKAQSRPEGEDE